MEKGRELEGYINQESFCNVASSLCFVLVDVLSNTISTVGGAG